ncbi:MAG TPA: magnesium transporter [Candidatus Dormibacteraeota bacterium]|nr:magnesium transporter [Candidatus Dormibacteraeota bacterium]
MVKLNKKTREQYTKIILNALHDGDMKQFRSAFLELHPSDQLDVFITLNKTSRNRVYSYLSPKEFAEIFGGLNINKQLLFFLELDEHYAFQMFNHMFTDDVVNFLTEINDERAEAILSEMDKDKAQRVKALLSYTPETAGAIMTKELISISSSSTVEEILNKLRDEAPTAEIIYYLYVVDEENKLVGVVSLRDLIIATPTVLVKDIMSTRVVSVPEDMDQEEVGHLIKKYDFLAAPVVSKQNKLLGIITVDDIMDILEDETTEDFGEISATKGATDLNLSGFVIAKKRAPWIIALMFFGLITANIIGQFEETLEAVVLLAVFIPMIMDSAGNVGTQSLAVSVRGLALGTLEKGGFWRMIRRELSAGFLLGFICMILITIMITILYDGNWMLALIVGVSLLITLSVSTVIGSTVPLIINKLKLDPAIASGPFITTINDILGLMIYFSIATSLMMYL